MSLTNLPNPNQTSIINSLKSRSQQSKYYTWCGNDILISINPCRNSNNLTGEQLHAKYAAISNVNSVAVIPESSMEPHPYELAAKAWTTMKYTRASQTIFLR